MTLFPRKLILQYFIMGQLFFGAAFFVKSQTIDSVYTVLSHHVDIHIFPSSNHLLCNDTLRIHKAKHAQSITLMLLRFYKIENLSIPGRSKIEYERNNDLISINDLPRDTVFNLIIKYSGQFLFHSEFSAIDSAHAIIRDFEFLPTGPKRLGFVRFRITVPKEWESIAVGQLVDFQNFNDSSSYVWEFNQPIPEIGWVVAGKFKNFRRMHGEIPLTLRLFPEDSSSAPTVLDLSSSVLNFYSEKFINFRFPKLDIVEIEDWVAGGNVLAIACPSFIMVKKRAFITNDQFNRVESVLAHEIAHQWWPLTVFIDEKDVAFLAEGMCEYSSILYNEIHNIKSRRDSLATHPLLRSLIMKIQQGKDLPLQQKLDIRTNVTQYLKASYVHHMLRKVIGDTAFWDLYKKYANNFSLQTASLSDFQLLAENVSGQKLDWFFDQWVKKRGAPQLKIYNVKTRMHEHNWITQGRVRIVGYDKYTISGFITAVTSKGNNYSKFSLGYDLKGDYRNDVPFELVTYEKPLRVMLDPDGELLKLQKLPPKLSDLRDPLTGIMVIGTKQNFNILNKIARNDSVNLEKAGWNVIIKNDTSVTLNDFQNERVFLYGKLSENSAIETFESKFPIRFLNDTLYIDTQKLYDSTLTLFEIIENPFLAGGLITWIVPFSEKVNSELIPYDESWIVMRGKDEIASGTWEVVDANLVVEVK